MTRDKDLYWRFINSGACPAAFNMALDEALMRRAADPPTATLRVYAWEKPSVSLGYHQKIEERLDLERCRAAGVEVVRRITGGREVFHQRELTYSFSAPLDNPRLGGTVMKSYRAISGGLVRALEILGLEPELERSVKRAGAGAGVRDNPCFSSASRYEISWQGKKLVGSAQRRMPRLGAFLQQGSLLIENSQDRLLKLRPKAIDEEKDTGNFGSLGARATGLEEVLGRKVGFEEVARAMHRGFEEFFGCRFEEAGPAKQELKLARDLEENKYTFTDYVKAERLSAAGT
ncbi:MAG: lipoate--protein ligase family protein [Gemmatimonadota bacterium]|nr:lipoate--protein ligase family protein [Gemmatimonadota bacterium]